MKSAIKLLSSIISLILAFALLLGVSDSSSVSFTPIGGRAYTDEEIVVNPDSGKHINVAVQDEGIDIFNSLKYEDGYRYGASIFSNADGSLDCFFAAPGTSGEWDWITYKHSPDSGKSWTAEKKVLSPTPGSRDAFSTCDPGVIRIGDYWYIGYTSTENEDGVFNHVYVARSKNIDGPYEKWNGKGWGGNPVPIITFEGKRDEWGMGEPSFVYLRGTLFIYYTCRTDKNETLVALADGDNENWPLTIVKNGTAITYDSGSSDSADVKYVEDYGKFIAVSTSERFTDESSVTVYESDDGLKFNKTDILKTNIASCCHNAGISSRTNGHLKSTDSVYIAYAYGSDWGKWSTRLNKVSLSLGDEPDFSDAYNKNNKTEVIYADLSFDQNYVGISDDTRVYNLSSADSVSIKMYALTETHLKIRVLGKIKYSGYDTSVVKMRGNKIIPLKPGSTILTAEYCGMTTQILINVN